MTLSDFVQSPVLPALMKVESSTSNSFWLSKLTVKRLPWDVDTQSAPCLLGNSVFHAVAVRHGAFGRKGQPLTVLHFVKHNVIFKRVGAHDVVVVGVQVAPYQAGTLIHAAGYRLKLDRECAVFEARAIRNGQRKASRSAVRRNLCQNIRLAGGRNRP
jgi:hypothetical protein